MAETILSADNGDSFPVSGTQIEATGDTSVFQYVNGLDVEATFTLKGSYSGDGSFSEAVTLAETTVASGASGRDGLSEEWDILRVEVDATSPSSGTAEAYLHEVRNNR